MAGNLRVFAQPPQRIGIPIRAIWDVDPQPMAFGQHLAAKLGSDAVEHLKLVLLCAEPHLADHPLRLLNEHIVVGGDRRVAAAFEQPLQADDEVEGVSWTFSVSYATPIGIRPYITFSEQSTLIAGQGADLGTNSIRDGGAFDTSELMEIGLKGSLLDDKLYFALAYYEQERTDFSAQSIVTNQSTETEGIEFELRWSVTDKLLMTAGWSNTEVVNINTLDTGYRFSFIGADDLPNVPAEALYGGTLGGNVYRPGRSGAVRAGMPENVYSVTGTYDFNERFAGHFSVIHAEETNSGFSGQVELPDYTLLNVGVLYHGDQWMLGVNIKNVTDEEYFRSNFPNLFGGTIVLPELPRHYSATLQYSF